MPRPRFTLRAALVVTTLAALLAWQYSIVLRRKEAMDSDHAFILALPAPGHIDPSELAEVNPLRELLGDQAVQFIYVAAGDSEDADLARMQALFPEASVDIASPPLVWTRWRSRLEPDDLQRGDRRQ